MGFFSWKTSDTGRSIANSYSVRETFTVHMITEDGQVFTENDYEGYGVFGGKDLYELIADLNGLCPEGDKDQKRTAGIGLVFLNNSSGSFSIAAERGVKLPKLVEDFNCGFNDCDYPEDCEFQGFFYDDDDYDDDDDDDDDDDEDDDDKEDEDDDDEEDDDEEDEEW